MTDRDQVNIKEGYFTVLPPFLCLFLPLTPAAADFSRYARNVACVDDVSVSNQPHCLLFSSPPVFTCLLIYLASRLVLGERRPLNRPGQLPSQAAFWLLPQKTQADKFKFVEGKKKKKKPTALYVKERFTE